MPNIWQRFKTWLRGEAPPRPEWEVNREQGSDKARRAMYPELTDEQYEEMARRNGWRDMWKP